MWFSVFFFLNTLESSWQLWIEFIKKIQLHEILLIIFNRFKVPLYLKMRAHVLKSYFRTYIFKGTYHTHNTNSSKSYFMDEYSVYHDSFVLMPRVSKLWPRDLI